MTEELKSAATDMTSASGMALTKGCREGGAIRVNFSDGPDPGAPVNFSSMDRIGWRMEWILRRLAESVPDVQEVRPGVYSREAGDWVEVRELVNMLQGERWRGMSRATAKSAISRAIRLLLELEGIECPIEVQRTGAQGQYIKAVRRAGMQEYVKLSEVMRNLMKEEKA